MTAIYETIRLAVESGVDVEDLELDDETDRREGLRWAAGAWEGVSTHHVDDGVDESSVEALAAAIVQAVTGDGYAELCALADTSSLLSLIDRVLDDVRAYGPDPAALESLGVRLARTAESPGAVKLGIALLGRYGEGGHRDVLLTLGRHNEFTLYAAVALAQGSAGDDDLWQLARQVHGWGRIHLVERLAESQRTDIREWILRHGFRNSIMNEYLAWQAATAGGLLGHLLVDDVDEELLLATADVLHALLEEGPARDMTDYPDGAAATMAYLSLVPSYPPNLSHLLTVGRISDYATADRGRHPWPPGWTPAMRETCAATCAAIISAPHWRELVETGIDSPDRLVAWQALGGSRVLGMSTVRVLMRQLREQDHDAAKWFELIDRADADTIDSILDLAGELLPLAEIASGPSPALGIGPGFEHLAGLDFIVSALDRWPGRGWPLIAAAMRSPGVRLRSMAVRALAAWDRDDWPDDAEALVREARDREPDRDLRRRIEAMLPRPR